MTDAITRSAKGMDCEIRIPMVCNFDPATTVWCHANGSSAGKGNGMKSYSALGAYGCFACHNLYDRRTILPKGMCREDVELYFWDGHARSLRILIEKGLVKT